MQRAIGRLALLGIAILSVTASPRAAQLKPETIHAFDSYVRAKEEAANRSLAAGQFLKIDAESPIEKSRSYSDLRSGRVLIEPAKDCSTAGCGVVPGGLIHDWTGLVFVPSVSLGEVLAGLQNYDRDSTYYQPEVVKSQLLDKSGGDFSVFLRLKRAEVITVVYDTKYDVRYTCLDASHALSRSYSTSIQEVKDAGTPAEQDLPPGHDRGFLWRLYSYWRFYQAEGGVYIQCNAISLTRDIPTGLGWMVGPFLEKIPKESLHFTLDSARAALAREGARDPRR